MKNNFLFLPGFLVLAAVLAIPSAGGSADSYGTTAGQSLGILVNARAGGLAGSYSALAADASTIGFNPAGLGVVRSLGLVLMHQVTGPDVFCDYAASSFPLPFGTIGAEYGLVGVKPFTRFSAGYATADSLEYADWYAGAAFGRDFLDIFSVGLGARYVHSGFGVKGTSDLWASADTVALNAGALATFKVFGFDKDYDKNLRIGVSAMNLLGGLSYVGTRHPLTASLRAGLYYQPIKYVNVLSDWIWQAGLPASFGVGVEVLPEWILSLRTGFRKQADRLLLAAGLGLRYQIGTVKFGFDYALDYDPEFGLQHWFSLDVQRFSASLSDFTIASSRIIDVFPGMYKYYSSSKVASVELRNNTSVPVEQVKVSFFVKDYMDFPSESEVIPVLRPHTTAHVDLPASFNNRVLEISEDTPSQALLKVEYFAEGKQQQASETRNFKLYNRNAMTWDSISKLASFITPKDPPVQTFARGLAQSYKDAGQAGVDENLATAALIFDALGRYGMTYVLDPQSPLRKRGTSAEQVDYIQFPRDCLRFKSGDCDDLTVLFCSLLQNVGVNTALVDLRDHIMMMFDTGVPEEDRLLVAADADRVVIRGGTVWVPVETTMYGRSFIEAWNFGLDEYSRGSREGRLTVVEVSSAWDDFPPVTLEQTAWEPGLPDRQGVLKSYRQDLDAFEAIGTEGRLQELEKKLAANPSDFETLNKAALLYAYKDDFDRALKLLNQAVQAKPNIAKVWNNLGNVYFLKTDLDAAERAYLKAMDLNPDNPGYYINLAVLYNQKGDSKKAIEMTEKADKLMK